MPPFGAWERVKGKRVQIPHDLVTVIREPAARVRLHRSLGLKPGDSTGENSRVHGN